MAVPGKFETNYKVFCAACQTDQVITARSTDWTGDLRTPLICSTPGCGKIFEDNKRRIRSTKGNISCRQQIPLISLPCGDEVVLEDYDCSERDAERFCSLFRDVMKRIPKSAHEALLAHWQTGKGSPHVWLLENRKEWSGSGWAACRTQGLSLCMVSSLIGLMPDEIVCVAIAHELGHTLFIAGVNSKGTHHIIGWVVSARDQSGVSPFIPFELRFCTGRSRNRLNCNNLKRSWTRIRLLRKSQPMLSRMRLFFPSDRYTTKHDQERK